MASQSNIFGVADVVESSETEGSLVRFGGLSVGFLVVFLGDGVPFVGITVGLVLDEVSTGSLVETSARLVCGVLVEVFDEVFAWGVAVV